MSKLSVIQLPKPVTGETLLQQSRSMRKLRMLSLQTDPKSFFTRYEDEVDKPIEFAMGRVGDPAAHHFVALDQSTLLENQADGSNDANYLAFMVMVRTDSSRSTNTQEYSMAAVYVHPDHRGKGVCTSLIRLALEWAKNDSIALNRKEILVHTAVAEANPSAERLYKHLGFQEASRNSAKNSAGTEILMIKMELRIV